MEAAATWVFRGFNLCEGILWIAIAIGFAVVYRRKRQNGDLMLASGLLFLAFGLSDFVEIRTGAWYEPWWLLLWKAATLAGFLSVYILFRRRNSSACSATEGVGQVCENGSCLPEVGATEAAAERPGG